MSSIYAANWRSWVAIARRAAWRWWPSARTTRRSIRRTARRIWRRRRARRATRSRIYTTNRSAWRRRIARPARRTFSCSARATSSSIAVNSTTAAPATGFLSRAKTYAQRSTPCWQEKRSPPNKSRAWAATSSGSPATHRIILATDQAFGNFSSTSWQRTCMSSLWPSWMRAVLLPATMRSMVAMPFV